MYRFYSSSISSSIKHHCRSSCEYALYFIFLNEFIIQVGSIEACSRNRSFDVKVVVVDILCSVLLYSG